LNYQNAGGSTGTTPQQWPSGPRYVLDRNRDTLIMFARIPNASCTRASVEELNRLLARSNGKAAAAGVASSSPADFQAIGRGPACGGARRPSPVFAVHEDANGTESRLFGGGNFRLCPCFMTRGGNCCLPVELRPARRPTPVTLRVKTRWFRCWPDRR